MATRARSDSGGFVPPFYNTPSGGSGSTAATPGPNGLTPAEAALYGQIEQLMLAGPGGSTRQQDEPPVNLPNRAPRDGNRTMARMPVGNPRAGTSGRRTTTRSDALLEFYRWSEAERRQWGEYLAGLGLLDEEDIGNYTELRDAWVTMVEEAAGFASAGGSQTPWDAARIMASGLPAADKDGPFTGRKTQTAKQIDLTDPTTAKAMVNDVLSKALGRAATDEELRAFGSVLNQAERSNPVTATTVSDFVEGDLVSSSTTRSGGIDRNQVLQDRAMQTPEYGAYQAAATYFPALLSAIQSPV